ncbi:hypothetical protein [Ornithinimicrobium sp. INDO-MA30-4]|uniref:hypothetical protein n=1 Tax=Ornithinimicrobium sp. INDO-MA30-4 TaxID=2908651 RepID=UPI002883095D|nr:hypothetical protein [Ornithinimicrobium sp. INDO-MA30-4]
MAVAPAGQDPNELLSSEGADAVKALVDGAQPMFEFAVRTRLAAFDLNRAEDRVRAMRAVAPIVGSIRDQALRVEYVRSVAGWLGMDVDTFGREVAKAGRAAAAHPQQPSRQAQSAGGDHEPEREVRHVLPAPTCETRS